MNEKRTLAFVLLAAVTLASVGSHLLAHRLRIIRDAVRVDVIGPGHATLPIQVTGSSLVFYGIDWEKIATITDHEILAYGSPSASPCEIEAMPLVEKEAALRVIGISAYDMNERNLSDYRAALVPVEQAASDLWTGHEDWPFAKRVFSQYPLQASRTLFPTAGLSTPVMVRLRDEARALFSHGPVLAAGVHDSDLADERLSDWEPGRVGRNIATIRTAIAGGTHIYGRTKRLALLRLLARCSAAGPTMLIVMPVSPAYRAAFLRPEDDVALDQILADAQKSSPSVELIRIDKNSALNESSNFCDIIHLNRAARGQSTPGVIAAISRLTKQP